MATTLSSPFKWKSNNKRYLRLHGGEIRNQDGILEFTREDSSLIFTKEISQNYSECVNQIEWFHKHSEANCYLKVEQKEEGWLIVATAHTPNDDKDDENCTLFTPEKPDIVKPNTFRIRHAQNNLYLRPQKLEQYGLDAALCAVSSKPDDTGEVDVFTITGS
ncbi:hypothetical protein D8674_031498 [Pyrus ussuriensis x Pyrus communis]|uniref:Agglutinin domain-containing protein n=1 Tax=Pyrus ussuriensis x Pyrus communis TaxID=2448454 RepID=A0A5N5EYR3_9ROSA|nr:hypothetical protein D8674_031498 [Pyrus ussuriensis x Pyrus communis]